MIDALKPYAQRGVPIVGLEPSVCSLCATSFCPVSDAMKCRSLAEHALLFEEFLSREAQAGKSEAAICGRWIRRKALLHGHCHQKAFGAMSHVERVLRLVPGLRSRRRVELLRHGWRVRLRGRALRRVDADGRGEPAAGRARGGCRYD